VSPLLAGRIARGARVEFGWLETDGDRIRAAGVGPPPRTPDERHDGLIAPGLCDLQVSGAGGHEVTGGAAALDAIDALMLAHGVTSYLANVITTDEQTAERAVAEIAERARDPRSPVEGVHLEGPFLAPQHAGMHRTALLRQPVDGLPPYYRSPAVRVVTLAPELSGALELIAELRDAEVTVSLGHSGASADVTHQAVDAGATLVTHVFNGMAPLDHRAPGLAGAALVDDRLSVCVIADGLHVDPLVLELIRRAAGDRVVLVTDASPAAAAPPGTYAMAGVEVEVREDGSVRDVDGRLAGSGLALDQAVRNWAGMTGATLAQALSAASERSAAAIGRPALLRPGSRADLVLLDEDGHVQRVMRHGDWLV
jgi:N-acetylglucosamine-6-phosphate deacetylase